MNFFFKRWYFSLTIVLQFLFNLKFLFPQPVELTEIKRLVQIFQKDDRGPFQAIRWFCPDGTMLPPNERCPQPGGIQHGLQKDIVQKIARENKIFLGQVLAGTPYEDFWDAPNQQSRLKQYQMEKYLQTNADGWIFRKARYYRGAVQAEDEEAWGVKFLTGLVIRDEVVQSNFFLLRQAVKDIPHLAHDSWLNNIRAVSKTISDSIPAFVDIRVKIHGQPDADDLQRVRDFRLKNQTKINSQMSTLFQTLEKDLEIAYQQSNLQSLAKYLNRFPAGIEVTQRLKKLGQISTTVDLSKNEPQMLQQQILPEIAEIIWIIRLNLLQISKPVERLAMIDLSVELEEILFRYLQRWRAQTVGELLIKNYTLAKAIAGCGFLEIWEWQQVEPFLRISPGDSVMSLARFQEKAAYTNRIVEWSTSTVRSIFEPVITLFAGFEPLANGFFDDRIRSSLLLSSGSVAGLLSDEMNEYAGISNFVMGIPNQNQVRGLNPGFALGELQVIPEIPDEIEFSSEKIYFLQRPPADLKPVAGIATVTEGNLVSHVQLLCKNLGIPNANLSRQNLLDLQPFSGKTVFYAVSPQGTVIIKPVGEMTHEEKILVEVKKRSAEKIAVPVDKINLKQRNLLSLRRVKARDSGKICGPKAANLGQLKELFPDHVVEGIVIPFGIFRQHLDQKMPGSDDTFWQFLQQTFQSAEALRKNGANEAEIENRNFRRLSQLRDAIHNIRFLPDFLDSFPQKFREIFGTEIGSLPVFIRSDTNMEDLKDFTGAGLNLTVFNVVETEKILQAIRDVWASPYTERSYRWRQKFLLNPENVFPSILVIPSVNVDKSGVLITSGVMSGNRKDVTVAFNRGAGGAVEGQMAESWLLRQDRQNLLFYPSRETQFTVLPTTGGMNRLITSFQNPILNAADLETLRQFAAEIEQNLPGVPGIETDGPFDVELGFKDGKIWLFQVRPYIENKRAKSTTYLLSLDPKINPGIQIFLDQSLNN